MSGFANSPPSQSRRLFSFDAEIGAFEELVSPSPQFFLTLVSAARWPTSPLWCGCCCHPRRRTPAALAAIAGQVLDRRDCLLNFANVRRGVLRASFRTSIREASRNMARRSTAISLKGRLHGMAARYVRLLKGALSCHQVHSALAYWAWRAVLHLDRNLRAILRWTSSGPRSRS